MYYMDDSRIVKKWVKNGKFHRVDGPAIEDNNGDKFWFKENNRHRIDGPAIEWAGGGKKWYYEDKEIKCESTEEFIRIINMKLFW